MYYQTTDNHNYEEPDSLTDRVDWSRAFPGIEQPNEAYSPVLNNNVAYEQPHQRQPHPPPQYEEIQPHTYEVVQPPPQRRNYVNIDTDNL